MEFIDVALKSAIGVLAGAAVTGLIAFFTFLLKLKDRLICIQERLDENDKKTSVLVFSVAALFDKTFKGVENGRTKKAEEMLNEILYNVDKKCSKQ